MVAAAIVRGKPTPPPCDDPTSCIGARPKTDPVAGVEYTAARIGKAAVL